MKELRKRRKNIKYTFAGMQRATIIVAIVIIITRKCKAEIITFAQWNLNQTT